MKLSHLSETLIGSEIVKLGSEIKEKIRQGERIYNFTVGDFKIRILFPNVFCPAEPNGNIIINPIFRNHLFSIRYKKC